MTQLSSAVAPRALVVGSPVDVCSFVDGLGPDAAGELVFAPRGGATEGAVFVEHGRVCWAAARGLARRLGDLLAGYAKLDAAGMESLYRRCKQQRVPLGESLVDGGLVSPTDLRAALLLHTAESLRALCARSTTASWLARRHGGYSPRFTFSTPELLVRTLGESHGPLTASAAAELACVLGDDDWGAAFVRSGARASPDPVCALGALPSRVEPLLRLGRWAASALDVVAALEGEDPFLATVHEAGTLVAWRSGQAFFAGVTGPHGPARMLNRRATVRRGRDPHGRI